MLARERLSCVDVTVREAMPGSAEGFDAWASARVPGLLRFARLVTGSHAEAEDAVQAALERAIPRWERIARAEDPDAYVRRMVVNAHVSLWRRAGRRESPVPLVLRSAEDPAERVTTAEAVRRLCAALPTRQRAAVVLRFFEDRDYTEIAAILGCSEATARSHVHRALRTLRRELDREE